MSHYNWIHTLIFLITHVNISNGELLYLTDKHHVFVYRLETLLKTKQEKIDSRFGITPSFVQLTGPGR